MGLRKWRTAHGIAIADKERLMVSDDAGATYHWASDRADQIHVYQDGKLIESVFVRAKLTRSQAIAEIDATIAGRNVRPEAQA